MNRHAAVFATQAGSLGYITPLLNESMEPLLQKLQRQMVLAQPQPAGLNPAAFRCTWLELCDHVGSCLHSIFGAVHMHTSSVPEAAYRHLTVSKT